LSTKFYDYIPGFRLRSIFFYSSTALVGPGLLCEVPRSYSDTPHSVGLLWTSDRPLAETATW